MMPLATRKTGRKFSLYDLTPSELESFFLSIGEESYRASQVLDFLYRHPVDTIDEMTTLSKELRDSLSKTTVLAPFSLRATVESPDGTIKHAYEMPRARKIISLLESVWMPAEKIDVGPFWEPGFSEEDRGTGSGKSSNHNTLCVSSQIGCAGGCSFCATGSIGLKGQLSAGEIVYQVVYCLAKYGSLPDAVLFMGMGEPMHNFDAVCAAVEIMTHPDALGLSPRRIVLSTTGELERLGAFNRRFPRVRLAISLNAATDTLRTKLMPINEQFDLTAIQAFIKSTDQKKSDLITLEYVVIDGLNNIPSQIMPLKSFLMSVANRVKVNLIPYNVVDGKKLRAPSRASVYHIQRMLRELGIKAFIRRNRGSGVSAACGQLSGKL